MSRPTSRVSRVLMTGPLAPFADQYRERLRERRYARLSAVTIERQVAQMSRWLEAEGLGVEQLSEARVEAFVSFQRASGRGPSSLSRPGVVCLIELLRELGVVAAGSCRRHRPRRRSWTLSGVTCCQSAACQRAPCAATWPTRQGSWPDWLPGDSGM